MSLLLHFLNKKVNSKIFFQFRPKLEVRGRPKRSERQLCIFNKTRADRVETEDGRGKKRRTSAGQAPSTKRQRLSKAMSPVCDLPSQLEMKEWWPPIAAVHYFTCLVLWNWHNVQVSLRGECRNTSCKYRSYFSHVQYKLYLRIWRMFRFQGRASFHSGKVLKNTAVSVGTVPTNNAILIKRSKEFWSGVVYLYV